MLKNLTLLFASMILFIGTSLAQKSDFVVNEIQETMSQGQQTGLEILIPETQVKNIQSALSKWTKSNKGKFVSSKKSPEIFQDNVLLPSVSENTIDLYTTLTQQKNGVLLKTFVDLGGAFLSSSEHPQAFTAMEGELINFARNQYVAKVGQDVTTEEKNLSKLQSDFKKLQKDNESYHKDISKNQDNIQEQQLAIQKNQVDQKSKQDQIAIQQQILMEARQKNIAMGSVDKASQKLLDGQVKTEEKTLKTFQSQFKKLQKDYSNSIKSIEKSKSIIAQREQDIVKNEQDQKVKEQQIELQKQIVDAVKTKKAGIQ